ncbi:hypothetical protein SAMN05216410_3051 [Sanguibacter gelidistatuariae]|uniref:YCII-related domain-containing protein n=1 Tax=Sanguibacter gelidistatuariae TaxID=1814289 RepID=A0A1G6T8D1_9MICO|nr:YciI family protein [Sanguibacter gelidistatuariae]SDD25370.1 hypothetical protein SAMN05216410_3051 [Sanguibacter gelidistatuariae]
MTTYAVTYVYDARSAERDTHRPAHRGFLAGLYAAGVLLASGPVADGDMQGALLIIEAGSAEKVAAILDTDPFAVNDLVADRAITEWAVVFGPWSS